MARRKKLKPSEWIWGSDLGPFEGNDVRQHGGHFGRCILCGSRGFLRLSHIVPKWAYQWHKNAWQGEVVTCLLSKGVMTKQQDGAKHYLMCERCEQHASKAESYALSLVERNRKSLRSSGTIWIFSDYYWRLRLDLMAQFIAVTALRCHYAESVPHTSLKIPRSIRKQLRSITWHNICRDTHSVLAWRFVPPKHSPAHDPRQDIDTMYEDAALGKIFLMLVGGIEWCLLIGRDPRAAGVLRGRIRGQGIEKVRSISYSEYRLFKYPDKWLPQIRERIAVDQQKDTTGIPPVPDT